MTNRIALAALFLPALLAAHGVDRTSIGFIPGVEATLSAFHTANCPHARAATALMVRDSDLFWQQVI